MECCQRTQKEACRRLGEVSDSLFISNLIKELGERVGLKSESGNNPENIVNKLLATKDKEQLQQWIYAIRRALAGKPKTLDAWDAQWQAASALFYMTVRQLITHPEMDDAQSEFVREIVQLPNNDPQLPQILGAIIAATLLGGILEFKGSGEDRKPDHVHSIKTIGQMGDDFVTPINLALFCACFPAHESTPNYASGSSPLSTQHEDNLTAYIKNAQDQEYKTVAFIFEGCDLSIEALKQPAEKFNVHLLWQREQDNEMLKEIFGMLPGVLLADIKMFWKIDTDTRAQIASSFTTQGAETMSTTTTTTNNFHNVGSVAQATGDHSNANAQTTQTGIDHTSLAPLLAALKQEVASANNPKLTENLNSVEQLINSKKPDKDLIAKGLEKITQGAGYIQSGEKIITAVEKMSAVLSPFFA